MHIFSLFTELLLEGLYMYIFLTFFGFCQVFAWICKIFAKIKSVVLLIMYCLGWKVDKHSAEPKNKKKTL